MSEEKALQAQLPEGGESGNGGERGDENSGGQGGGNGGGNNGDHVVLDEDSSSGESDSESESVTGDGHQKPTDTITTENPAEPEKAINSVRQSEAELAIVDGRFAIRNREDLEKLKAIKRTKDKPLNEVLPEDKPLWDDYVNYWEGRVKDFEKEFNKKLEREASTASPDGLAQEFKDKLKLKSPAESPDGPEKEVKKKRKPTESPRCWESYKEVLTNPYDRRGDGTPFQDHVLSDLQQERRDMIIEGNVGVIKEGKKPKNGRLKPTPKFVDQLAVDKQELQAWKDAGRPADRVPQVETYSNKSRNFTAWDKDEIKEKVMKDVKELLNKYSGRLENKARSS